MTANKREERLSKVGLTVDVLGAAQLKQQNITSLQDLALAVPGLTFTQTDSNTPVYTLRGIGFYDTTLGAYPAVSVYLDEAPLSFPTMTTQTLFDIERVEVLMGPQGTLFGNNSTGGAINYIAAKPTNYFDAGLSSDFARFNTFTEDAHVSGPITDNLLGRIAIHTVSGDDWQRSITRPNDTNGAPLVYAGRFLLDWQATDSLRIQTDVNGWRDRTQPPQAQFQRFLPNFPTRAPLPKPFIPNTVDDSQLADWSPLHPPEADNRLFQATLRADYDLTDSIVLTSLTNYVDYLQHQVPDGDGVPEERIDVVENNGYIRSFSDELRIADNKDPVFRWTAGANYSHDVSDETDATAQHDATSNYTYIFAGLHFPGNTFTNHQVMNNYAAFGSGEYTIGEFTLKAGARFTEADRTSDNCNLGFIMGPEPNTILEFFNILTGKNYPPGTCTIFHPDGTLRPFHGVLNQNNVSWRVGVDWKPTDDFLAYLNVAKGYKAGSFPALSGSAVIAFSPVAQESVLDIEGGIKAQLLDHRLSINAAVFYNDYKDKQVKSKLIDPTFGSLDALVNIPKSSIRGFEVEANAHPELVPGLSLGASVTFLDTRLDESDGIVDLLGVPGNWNGNPIPRAPEWSINGNVNYTFPINDDTSGFVGGQLTFRSSTTSSIGNEPDFRLPAYTTIDMQAGVDFSNGQYRLMVWGKNITNAFYLTNINRYTDGIQRFAGMPDTYGVTLAYRY